MAKATLKTTKKAEPKKVGDVYVGATSDGPAAGEYAGLDGNTANPQSGLFGNGATLDLLRPLIDQLVKAGLDGLLDWLRAKGPAALNGLREPCGDVPACPDAMGDYMLVCNGGQKSWLLVPTALAAQLKALQERGPGYSPPKPTEDDDEGDGDK